MTDSNSKSTKKAAMLPKLGITAHFTDRQLMKIGHPEKTFSLKGPVPSVKLPIDWTKGNSLSFPLDGNNTYGDCMYAAACHGDNTFTGNVGAESQFDPNIIVADYLKLSPGDHGLNSGQIIGAWEKGLANNPSAYIDEALSLDPNDAAAMQAAIYLFGGVQFMLDVPEEWYTSFTTGSTWDAPAKADSNNGHAIWWNGVDASGNYKFQSWGTYGWITPAGVKVCDPSCFVVFSQRWFNTQGIAPNGLTYDQLASLWVQFGGSALPYQKRILEVPTTFAIETDGTYILTDYDRDGIPDLAFIKTGNTLSGRVEVHIASGKSNYQTRIFESATAFNPEIDGVWTMADFDKDGIPDLIFIKTANTPSGQVEVHVASGASQFQTKIFESATAFSLESDGVWTIADYDGDGRADLVFIKTSNTPNGHVEVHVASAASNYQELTFQKATVFSDESNGTWMLANYEGNPPDLVYIKTSNTPTGQVEVHVASGSSQYQATYFEYATTFKCETDGVWQMARFTAPRATDLAFIKTANTPSGQVEVHVAAK